MANGRTNPNLNLVDTMMRGEAPLFTDRTTQALIGEQAQPASVAPVDLTTSAAERAQNLPVISQGIDLGRMIAEGAGNLASPAGASIFGQLAQAIAPGSIAGNVGAVGEQLGQNQLFAQMLQNLITGQGGQVNPSEPSSTTEPQAGGLGSKLTAAATPVALQQKVLENAQGIAEQEEQRRATIAGEEISKLYAGIKAAGTETPEQRFNRELTMNLLRVPGASQSLQLKEITQDINGEPHTVSVAFNPATGEITQLAATKADDPSGLEEELKKVQIRDAGKAIIKLDAIPGIIDRMEENFLELNPGDNVSGKIGNVFRGIMGDIGVKEFSNFKSYEDTAGSMAVQIARSLGDVGNISEVEREINQKLLPKRSDTREVGLLKTQKLRGLIQGLIDDNRENINSILADEGIKIEPLESSANTPVNRLEKQNPGDTFNGDELDTFIDSIIGGQ